MFSVTGVATHTQGAVFKAAAFEVLLELAPDILRQRCAMRGHPFSEYRIVLVDELIEESGFRAG